MSCLSVCRVKSINDVIDPRDLYATLDRYLDNLISRSLIRRSEITPNKYMRHPTPLHIVDRSLWRPGYDCSILQCRTVYTARFVQSGRVHQTGSKSIWCYIEMDGIYLRIYITNGIYVMWRLCSMWTHHDADVMLWWYRRYLVQYTTENALIWVGRASQWMT